MLLSKLHAIFTGNQMLLSFCLCTAHGCRQHSSLPRPPVPLSPSHLPLPSPPSPFPPGTLSCAKERLEPITSFADKMPCSIVFASCHLQSTCLASSRKQCMELRLKGCWQVRLWTAVSVEPMMQLMTAYMLCTLCLLQKHLAICAGHIKGKTLHCCCQLSLTTVGLSISVHTCFTYE